MKEKKMEADNSVLGIRINKYLADSGICSRRDADRYIADGKVFIDGVRAETGSRVLPDQKVIFNGQEVNIVDELVVLALNKPAGIICTSDEREPDNVVDFVDYPKRIYPIGRLDKDSEGLLLLTNDGNIVNKILRAGNYHEKEYIVKVNKMITKDFLEGMAGGVPILDTVTRPCKVEAIDKTRFKIILTQGLNRQIRRMCEYFGYRVVYLQRVRIMNILLGHLKVGAYRKLSPQEIEGLKALLSNSSNAPVRHDPTKSVAQVSYEPKKRPAGTDRVKEEPTEQIMAKGALRKEVRTAFYGNKSSEKTGRSRAESNRFEKRPGRQEKDYHEKDNKNISGKSSQKPERSTVKKTAETENRKTTYGRKPDSRKDSFRGNRKDEKNGRFGRI